LIEEAYILGEQLGLSVWCADQAGPFQTVPHPGPSWQPQGEPARQPHEYIRNGTAKILTLFHPADGQVRVEGVTTCPNTVLHPWLKGELLEILAGLPQHPPTVQASRAAWERWQQGLSVKPTLPDELPLVRLLLVLDNLAGHKTPEFVLWLLAHGIMPLYTPVSGSWLNLAESIQRILKRRALAGQHPSTPEQIMAWFAAVAEQWNKDATPFEWGGRRKRRRDRQRERRHRVGGSGGYTRRPVARRTAANYGNKQNK
jgi:DDE superfamily endonuclease